MILKGFTVVLTVVMGLSNLWWAGDMAYESGHNVWLSYSSKGWPTVVGIIEQSRVIKYPTSKGQIAYKPEIFYRYLIGERVYTSSQIEFTMFGYDREDAAEICNEFAQGERAVIHYQAKYPLISTLKTGIALENLITFIVGVFWFLLATILILAALEFYKTPSDQFRHGYILALKKRFNWRGKTKSNIWKPPDHS